MLHPKIGVHDFQVAPTPLNISVEQGIAMFRCHNRFVDGIHWRINATPVNQLSLPKISTNVTSSSEFGGAIYLLSIAALLRYNHTTVQCVATFFGGAPQIITSPVMLLIQGSEFIIIHNTIACDD